MGLLSRIRGLHGGEYEHGCLLVNCPDDGGKVGKLVPDYTVHQPRRQPSTCMLFPFVICVYILAPRFCM